MGGITFVFLLIVFACGNDAPPMAGAIHKRDSLPLMTTYGVSKLISDSGVIRYKIIAEQWDIYDKTNPPRQAFPKGIFLEQFDENMRISLYLTADTAYCYNQNLWELRGRVFVRNTKGTTFRTEELFWDMGQHLVYSHKHIHIVAPDREVEGNSFRSNEQMTDFQVNYANGSLPMPHGSKKSGNDTLPQRKAPEKQAKQPTK